MALRCYTVIIQLEERATNMIKNILFGAAFGLGLFAFADYSFSIPDVHMSNATKTCVEVLNYPSTLFGTTNYSCENLPTKFNHVWVQ
mgnify:FL=1